MIEKSKERAVENATSELVMFLPLVNGFAEMLCELRLYKWKLLSQQDTLGQANNKTDAPRRERKGLSFSPSWLELTVGWDQTDLGNHNILKQG